jgi:hypothetical protein
MSPHCSGDESLPSACRLGGHISPVLTNHEVSLRLIGHFREVVRILARRDHLDVESSAVGPLGHVHSSQHWDFGEPYRKVWSLARYRH